MNYDAIEEWHKEHLASCGKCRPPINYVNKEGNLLHDQMRPEDTTVIFEDGRPPYVPGSGELEERPKNQTLTPEDFGSGVKHDEGKPKMSLVPQKAVREVARVMTFGADKYGQHNYLGGMAHLRLIDAALRHINSHLTGETIDPESGVMHLAHAGSSILMVIELILNELGTDDRFEGYRQ